MLIQPPPMMSHNATDQSKLEIQDWTLVHILLNPVSFVASRAGTFRIAKRAEKSHVNIINFQPGLKSELALAVAKHMLTLLGDRIVTMSGADPHRFPPVYGNRSDFS